MIDGKEHKYVASETEAFEGGQEWDLNPVIYYRLKKPIQAIESLPVIDIDKLFTKSEDSDSQI